MPRHEIAHLRAVFLAEHRTGHIGNAASGLHQRGGAIEQRLLLREALLQRAGAHPPFGVGIAPPGAGAGTGRVDQHKIDAAVKVGERVLRAARGAHLHIAHARARDPLVDRRELPLADVGCVKLSAIVHRRRQRQRLAAGAGRKIGNLFAGLCSGEQGGELRSLILDFHHSL